MSRIGSVASLSSSQLRSTVERVGRTRMISGTDATSTGNSSFANTLESAAELSGERISVNLSIDSLSARTFQRAVPTQNRQGSAARLLDTAKSGTRSNPRDLSSSLENIDPKIAQGIEALLDFIRQQDPEAAAALEETLTTLLGGQSVPQAPSFGIPVSNPSVPGPAGQAAGNGAGIEIEAQNIRFAVEMTYAQLQEQADGGASITAESVRITFEANFAQITNMQRADPLALDLDGNGRFDTTSVFDGHTFDLLGTGKGVRAATIAGGDGLLAFDRNENGRIDSGKELFGDQHGAEDGFAELAKFDENGDGVIDANDSIFNRLLVFRDANLNGSSEAKELTRLSDYRIAGISLDSTAAAEETNGNLVSRVGSFVREDGSRGRAGDLLLNYLA